MKKYLIISLLGFYSGLSLAQTCSVSAGNIDAKVKWVMEGQKFNLPYYQACLNGKNTPEDIKKFIDCKENTADCRVNSDPAYCENYCPQVAVKEPEKVKDPQPVKETTTSTQLRCDGGSLNNGGGVCASATNSDPTKINFLSFNLFWWNAFDQKGGTEILGNIKKRMLPADLMAFQECSDVRRVLNGIGLPCYASYDAGHAVALAWNPQKYELLSSNRAMVGLDQGYDRWNANRVLGFVRLKVKETGQTIFFANIHGVLGVNTGGIPIKTNCEYLAHGNDRGLKDGYISRYKVSGNDKTFAQNIVDVIKANIKPDDVLILAGDFNIDKDHRSEDPLKQAFDRVTAEWVDKIFIQKDDRAKFKKIDVNPFFHATGSDHRAIRIEFSL